MQRPQELRREPTHPHLELEVVRVPAHRQIAHERETDVVGGEVADVVCADLAALRVRDRYPRREEDHRAYDREQHPEDRLHAIRGGRLDLGDEERAVRANHALTIVCSVVKTRSMTSSIGGSSTQMSARRVPRAFTTPGGRSGAPRPSPPRGARPPPPATT